MMCSVLHESLLLRVMTDMLYKVDHSVCAVPQCQFVFQFSASLALQACLFLIQFIHFSVHETYNTSLAVIAAYSGLLILNCLGAMAYLIAASQHNGSGSAGATFGVSMLYIVLFIPCSFVCWYRPAYNAFQ